MTESASAISYLSVQELRPVWKTAMHVAYVATHIDENHPENCSHCSEFKKDITLQKLESTVYSHSDDLQSLALFCLGVFFTSQDKVSESEFKRGIHFLEQSVLLENQHAAHYLASIYAGTHCNKLSLSIKEGKKAIDYFIIAFKLGSYEGLNDLMWHLRKGQTSIAKDIFVWQKLLNNLFVDAGEAGDSTGIAHLIRCLIQQNYSDSHDEVFLFRAGEILSFWMKKSYWNSHYTALGRQYIQQGMDSGNKDMIYLNSVFSKSLTQEKSKSVGFFSARSLFECITQRSDNNYLNSILLINRLHNEISSIRALLLMQDNETLFISTAFGKLHQFACRIAGELDEFFPRFNKENLVLAIEEAYKLAKDPSSTSDLREKLSSIREQILAVPVTKCVENPSLQQILLEYMDNLNQLVDALDAKNDAVARLTFSV